MEPPALDSQARTPPSSSYLNGHSSHLRCACCAADLCPSSQIISKGFTGRHGRAYLVSATPVGGASSGVIADGKKSASLPNTQTHKAVPRQLVTGAHIVSDVSCALCGSVIGWKYEGAEDESQRYKVGKFILETKKIYSSSCWEGAEWDQAMPSDLTTGSGGDTQKGKRGGEGQHVVHFDSEDEDECEDLFAGVWSPGLALKRRQAKRFGMVMANLSPHAAFRR